MPCSKCGWCCKHQGVVYPTDPIRDEFMLARGWKRLMASQDGKQTLWIQKHRCPNLGQDNGCKVYDKRPVACQVYPNSLLLHKIGMDPRVGLGRKCRYKWNEVTERYN